MREDQTAVLVSVNLKLREDLSRILNRYVQTVLKCDELEKQRAAYTYFPNHKGKW